MAFKLPRDVLEELDLLIDKLARGAPDARQDAISRLQGHEQSGRIPLDAIVDLAVDSNPSLAMYAIQALGRNGSPGAAARLIELLERERSGNPIMLETIVDALGETGQKSGAQALLGLLGMKYGWKARVMGWLKEKKKGAPENTRQQTFLTLPVVRALARLADPKAAEAGAAFLEHEDPLVRWHAIQGLLKTRVTEFNGALERISREDPNEMVKEAAGIALEELSPLPRHLNN